jgi:hypothetical protein
MPERRNAYNISVRKPEGKKPLRKPTHIREIGWEGVDWIHLAQDWTSGGLL